MAINICLMICLHQGYGAAKIIIGLLLSRFINLKPLDVNIVQVLKQFPWDCNPVVEFKQITLEIKSELCAALCDGHTTMAKAISSK